MKLSAADRRGLALIADRGIVAISNATDEDARTLLWQTADRLRAAGLVTDAGLDQWGRQLLDLTVAGWDAHVPAGVRPGA